MTNYFAGRNEDWLLERRDALQEALTGLAGSQTHVGIAPGIFHEFERLSQGQLEDQLLRVFYALYLFDPSRYPNPYARAGITQVIFG